MVSVEEDKELGEPKAYAGFDRPRFGQQGISARISVVPVCKEGQELVCSLEVHKYPGMAPNRMRHLRWVRSMAVAIHTRCKWVQEVDIPWDMVYNWEVLPGVASTSIHRKR